jgi:hypothetical protein
MEKPPSPTDGEVSGGNITQDKSFGTGWCYHPRTKGRRQLLWLGNRGGWWGRGGGGERPRPLQDTSSKFFGPAPKFNHE